MKLIDFTKSILIVFIIGLSTLYSQNKSLSIEELISSSEFIVRGKITSVISYHGANNNIYSDVKFIVLEVFKGKIKIGKELNFTYMGGTIGNKSTTVLELPVFTDQIESFLFLNKTKNHDYYITNLAEGKFDIKKEQNNLELVLRDQHSSNPMIIKTSRGNIYINNKIPITLSDFKKQLEVLLKSER